MSIGCEDLGRDEDEIPAIEDDAATTDFRPIIYKVSIQITATYR